MRRRRTVRPLTVNRWHLAVLHQRAAGQPVVAYTAIERDSLARAAQDLARVGAINRYGITDSGRQLIQPQDDTVPPERPRGPD